MRTTLRIDDDLFRELKKREKTRDLGRSVFEVTKANTVAAELDDQAILRNLAGSR